MRRNSVIYSLVSLLLLMAMLVGCFASCKQEEEGTEQEQTSNGGEVETDPGQVDYMDQLPNGTYDSETITFLVMDNTAKWAFADFEEQTVNDVVREEIATMNTFIEDRYDIVFDYIWTIADKDPFMARFEQAALGAIDLDVACSTFYFGTELTGNVKNILDYSHIIQLENPYWISGWNDQATLNGQLYNPMSYSVGNLGGNTQVVYYSEFKARALGITDDMFQIVRDKNWTLETMQEYCKIAAVDNNGDASYNVADGDEFGLIYNLFSGRGIVAASGVMLAQKQGDDLVLDLTGGTEAFQDVYLFLKAEGNLYFAGNGGGAIAEEAAAARGAFYANKALFMADFLEKSEDISSEMDAFGELPLPKRDSTQSNYISYVSGIVSPQIMNNSKDPEMSATILEAMAIYNYSKLRPVYYDEQLKLRFQTDPTSAEMLDLIMDSILFDPLFVFSGGFTSVVDVPFSLIVAGNPNFSSVLKKKQTALETNLYELRVFFGLEEAAE